MAPRSWLDIAPDSPFSLADIPFGIITTPVSSSPHVGVATGEHALDLSVFALCSGSSDCPAITSHLEVFSQPALNDFAALGRAVHREVRHFLPKVFAERSKFSPAEGFTKPYDRSLLTERCRDPPPLPHWRLLRLLRRQTPCLECWCPDSRHRQCPTPELYAPACRLPWPSFLGGCLWHFDPQTAWPGHGKPDCRSSKAELHPFQTSGLRA